MSNLVRIIMHWTAGNAKPTVDDLAHYHFITDQDCKTHLGKFPPEANIKPVKGRYAAHTFNCNTGSIGAAMAGMKDANEKPLRYGPVPLTEDQVEAFCLEVAFRCVKYRIPVTDKTVLSHAEVQTNLGIKQKGKWDIAVLKYRPDLKGPKAVGDYLRTRVQHYVTSLTRPKPVLPPAQPVPVSGTPLKQLATSVTTYGNLNAKPRSLWGTIKSWFV